MSFPLVKKHLIGYSPSIPKWQQKILNFSLDFDLDVNLAEFGSSFSSKQLNWIESKNIPNFFKEIEEIERFLFNEKNFFSGFVVYPKTVVLTLGLEKTLPLGITPNAFYAFKTFKPAYAKLISKFNKRIDLISFKARGIDVKKSLRLLKNSSFDKRLIEANHEFSVFLDRLQEES